MTDPSFIIENDIRMVEIGREEDIRTRVLVDDSLVVIESDEGSGQRINLRADEAELVADLLRAFAAVARNNAETDEGEEAGQ